MTHTPIGAAPPRAPRPGETSHRTAVERVRSAAGTEPGRLRIIGAALAVLVVAFGAVTAWQVTQRSTAAGGVTHHSGPLRADAAEIYRSLADADATVTGGFLVGGRQPRAVSDRYQKDVGRATQLITQAAASGTDPADDAALASLNAQLPYYTMLVATAQADNLQGLPLGGAYLRYANDQMRREGGLLDHANRLYQAQTARLDHDYRDAEAPPWEAWALGGLALGALVWAQRRHYRRTNRVFNPGMVGASTITAVVLLWLVVAHTVARGQLHESDVHGGRSLQVLNDARITVLQARGDENLTLVARGSGDAYDASYLAGMAALAGKAPHGAGGELARALALADRPAGRDPVAAAVRDVRAWRDRHADERGADNRGDYPTAVAEVIGGTDTSGRPVTRTTGQLFDRVDQSLGRAVTQEQAEFSSAADRGHGALALLPFGAALLAVLAAAGAVLGVARRLSEYR